MSDERLNRNWVISVLLIGGLILADSSPFWGQELNRKTKNKVVPNYPELAQRMRITGVVKVLVTVAPNGTIKDAKLMGGHPVLATAALDAVRKWRFENGPEDSTGIVEFRFDPNQ